MNPTNLRRYGPARFAHYALRVGHDTYVDVSAYLTVNHLKPNGDNRDKVSGR